MPRRDLDDEDDRPRRRPARRREDDDEDRPARSRRRDDDAEDDRPTRRPRDDDEEDRPSRRRGGPARRQKSEPSQQKVLAGVGSVLAVLLVVGLVGLRIYLRATRDDRRTETANNQPAPVRPAVPPTGPPTGGPAMPVGPAAPAPAPAPQNLELTISNLRVERDNFRKLTLVFDYEFTSGHPFLDYCAVVTVPGKSPMIADLGRLRNRDTLSVAYTDFLAGGFPKGTSVYLGQRPRGSSAHPKTASNTLTLE